MKNVFRFFTNSKTSFIYPSLVPSALRCGLFVFVYLLSWYCVWGQSQVENLDSIPKKRIPISEFSLGRKLGRDVTSNNFKFYDFGISLNTLLHQVGPKTTFGFNPFFDIHVVDNRGYNKFGVRLFTEFLFSSDESCKIAVGPSWSNSFNNGYSASNASPLGVSGEFSYFFNPHFGLTSRWDRFQIPGYISAKNVNDISVGLKIRPRGLISALGYLFGIGSLGFNSILGSQ